MILAFLYLNLKSQILKSEITVNQRFMTGKDEKEELEGIEETFYTGEADKNPR